MRIVSVVGARPQFIKASVVSKAIRKKHEEVLVHTGQHYDYEMSKLFFDQLEVPKPDYNLGVGSGPQGEQTGKMIQGIEEILLKENPDLVLVYGDTNSTLAGALAAVKMHMPTGHVEAGLRSFDKTMPEEVNRVLTDHCSSFLFAPTKTAIDNLKNEGITDGVYHTGDVMYDVLLQSLKIAAKSDILKELNLESKEYFLTTVHRQANTDNPKYLGSIVNALSSVDEKVVFPIHPRTTKFLKNHGLEKDIKENILLTKPIGYFDFLWLQQNAKKILTDSGGIQKEAYLLNVPCITLRDTTEWTETIEDGWNVLVGSNKEKILDAVNNFEPSKSQRNVFGDGEASSKIAEILRQNGEKRK